MAAADLPTNPVHARFAGVPTPLISDNLDRLAGCVELMPYHSGGHMVGRALTVKTRAGDNLFIHQALAMINPGDVLVVDGGGETSQALVGEIMKSVAEMRGCAGFVIDGAIRDVAAFRGSAFPCFARGVIHRGPYKSGPGRINVPVSIGGWVISPGDIVVGDDDGVVSFPEADADRLAGLVEAQAEKEDKIMQSIRNGTYSGSYSKSV